MKYQGKIMMGLIGHELNFVNLYGSGVVSGKTFFIRISRNYQMKRLMHKVHSMSASNIRTLVIVLTGLLCCEKLGTSINKQQF